MGEIVQALSSFSAVVVGLGQIGMDYDLHLPEASHVLSHVRALRCHGDFRLLAAADPDYDQQQRFTEETGLWAYESVADLLGQHQPDVVVLACPTAFHPEVLAAVLENSAPRAILCEKPLAPSLAGSEGMIAACEGAGVALFVNFIRRADPGVREVRERIRDGRIAGPLKAIVWYSKGMLHNGSHFADLMIYWLGPIHSGRVIAPGRCVGDNDAEADFLLECDLGTAMFCAAREECYSHYTVEIVAANGRLRYERGGEIFWQDVEADENVAGYRRLSRSAQHIPSDMDRYQLHVMDELARALRGDSHSLCTGEEAIASQAWLERLYLERNSTKE